MKRKTWAICAVTVLAIGTTFATGLWVRANAKPTSAQNSPSKMKILTIKWQRLVGDTGKTCDRCGSTQEEVRKAHSLLRKSLAPLGINVVLEEKAMDKAAVMKNISESNRIWVAGKPLETWLSATSGMSDCTSCGPLCGSDVECRTVVVGGSTYESIPSELIIKAGLLSAAEMVGGETVQPRYEKWNTPGVMTIDGGSNCCP